MMDIVPTCLEIAGVDIPANIDGRSVLDMVTTSPPSPHDQIFWEYGKQRAMREGDWKLVVDGRLDFGRPVDSGVHLANLADDPGERTNLRDAEPARVARMEGAVRDWYDEVATP